MWDNASLSAGPLLSAISIQGESDASQFPEPSLSPFGLPTDVSTRLHDLPEDHARLQLFSLVVHESNSQASTAGQEDPNSSLDVEPSEETGDRRL